MPLTCFLFFPIRMKNQIKKSNDKYGEIWWCKSADEIWGSGMLHPSLFNPEFRLYFPSPISPLLIFSRGKYTSSETQLPGQSFATASSLNPILPSKDHDESSLRQTLKPEIKTSVVSAQWWWSAQHRRDKVKLSQDWQRALGLGVRVHSMGWVLQRTCSVSQVIARDSPPDFKGGGIVVCGSEGRPLPIRPLISCLGLGPSRSGLKLWGWPDSYPLT